MRSSYSLYKAGTAFMGVPLALAVAFDLASENQTTEKIAMVNTPVNERVTQCQQENQACNTSHAALFKCLEEKADKRDSDISALLRERSDAKFFYRGAMGFCVLYMGFLLAMVRLHRPQPAAKPQSPSLAPDYPA